MLHKSGSNPLYADVKFGCGCDCVVESVLTLWQGLTSVDFERMRLLSSWATCGWERSALVTSAAGSADPESVEADEKDGEEGAADHSGPSTAATSLLPGQDAMFRYYVMYTMYLIDRYSHCGLCCKLQRGVSREAGSIV